MCAFGRNVLGLPGPAEESFSPAASPLRVSFWYAPVLPARVQQRRGATCPENAEERGRIVDLVKEAFLLMKKGEAAFASGDFQESVNIYERAIEIVEGFPASYNFDKPAFIAQCKAGLSGACGQLTRFEDGLRYADEALEFYDRVGKFYGASASPWYMATFNKGGNLANLGRYGEGLEYIH